MLEITNLHARAGENEILRGVDLRVGAGEAHAIMGPNGSGKSTLAGVLAGRPEYQVTDGRILYDGGPVTTDEVLDGVLGGQAPPRPKRRQTSSRPCPGSTIQRSR